MNDWYRMPEREAESTKTSRKLIGTFWLVRREVIRTGYLVQPMDFDEVLVIDKAEEILGKEIESEMLLPPAERGTVGKRIAYGLRKRFGIKVLPMYEARGALMREHISGNPMRAIWYADLPGNYVMITGTKRCNIGEYYAPSGGFDSLSGEYDFDPGGLKGMKGHMLYTVRMLESMHTVQSNLKPNLFETWGHDTRVHPLDLESVEGTPAHGW